MNDPAFQDHVDQLHLRIGGGTKSFQPIECMFGGSSYHTYIRLSLKAGPSESRAHGISRVVAGRNQFLGR